MSEIYENALKRLREGYAPYPQLCMDFLEGLGYCVEPLGNEVKGRSKYISPDVQDAVESKKALFAETFLSDRDAVRFSGSRVPFEDDAKTAYANAVFRRNNYERLFRDAFHDAFVAKRCVVLVDWVSATKSETIDIQGATPDQYQQLLMQQNSISVTDENLVTDQTGLLSGMVDIEKDDSHVELHLVEPERYYRDPNASYPCQAMFVAMEQDVTRARLLMDGYEAEQVDGLQLTIDSAIRMRIHLVRRLTAPIRS